MTSTLDATRRASGGSSPPELTHWASGAALKGTSGRFSDVTDPATGRVTAHLPLASEDEAATVIAAAAAAFPSWRDTSSTRASPTPHTAASTSASPRTPDQHAARHPSTGRVRPARTWQRHTTRARLLPT